jgi:phage terminase Nu1 subunit (DNA packaging protein)
MKVTQAEFARICGVNRSTVSRWVAEGRIEADASGLIDPAAAQRMREATESPAPHHQARKAQFDEARKAQKTATGAFSAPDGTQGASDAAKAPETALNPPETASEAQKLGTALKLETYKLQKAKAERENMDLDKLAGSLVERSEVDYVLADLGNTLRSMLEGLPDRLASRVAAVAGNVSEIHKVLEEAMYETLGEMAANIKRKAEGFKS